MTRPREIQTSAPVELSTLLSSRQLKQPDVPASPGDNDVPSMPKDIYPPPRAGKVHGVAAVKHQQRGAGRRVEEDEVDDYRSAIPTEVSALAVK